MKILCVLFPHFPLQCEARRQPSLRGCPALVTRAAGSQRLVLDYSEGLDGLQCGMTLQQAISRHGNAHLLAADMPHYRTVFNEVLDSLEKVSPLVEGAELGCAYLGLDGLQSIYKKSVNALLRAVRGAISDVFTIQSGIAGGKFLAYLMARQSPPGGFRLLSEDAGAFLKDLPCDVLPVSTKNRQKLHDFGLHTLGQIAALPVGPLLSQFGPEGKRIWELSRGHDDTPLYPRLSEEVIEENFVLPSVTVSLEAILMAIESLLSRVYSRKSLRGRGICSLVLWTKISGSEYWERSIKFKEPAMNTGKALSRIKPVLESFPPPGAVEEMGLKLTCLGYQSGRQRNLFSDVRARDHLLDDIKQLEIRLGGPQVFRVKEVEPWSRIPERRRVLAPISR